MSKTPLGLPFSDKDFDFSEKNPHTVVHFLDMLGKLFSHVAPSATEEQKRELANLSKGILEMNMDNIEKIQENQERKIAEQRQRALKWTEDYDKVIKSGNDVTVTDEALESLNAKHKKTVDENQTIEAYLKMLSEKIGEQAKIHAEAMEESRLAHHLKKLELTTEVAELELKLYSLS